MKTLKLIGYDTLPYFGNTQDEFSINRFYDIIMSGLVDTEYILHVESLHHDGIPYDEWIKFDLRSSDAFTAVAELHSYLLNSISICNNMNGGLAGPYTTKDGKGDFDEKIKDIFIVYYEYI